MENFIINIQLRWSDFDPNFHVRHTSYYDWGSLCRIEFLENHGLTVEKMIEEHYGPVILREECLFKREVKHGDKVSISLEVLKAKKDFSRWTIQHPIKKQDDTIAAIVTIDGGFLDHSIRKLMVPNSFVTGVFSQMPRSQNFSWID